MDMDDLGFLGGNPDAERLAQRLDELRPTLCSWSARTIAARHPQLLRFRGVKGRRAWEQDLDFLVRHLHAAVASDGDGLGTSPAWLERTLGERGIAPDAVATAVDVTQEGLLRLGGVADGGRLARRLGETILATTDGRVARWLDVAALGSGHGSTAHSDQSPWV